LKHFRSREKKLIFTVNYLIIILQDIQRNRTSKLNPPIEALLFFRLLFNPCFKLIDSKGADEIDIALQYMNCALPIGNLTPANHLKKAQDPF
jgi:hypothetical protein